MPYPPLPRQAVRQIAIVVFGCFVALLALILVTSWQGSQMEQTMRDDLTRNGFAVVEVHSGGTAVLMIKGVPVHVQVGTDGGVGYYPYVTCPINTNGAVSDKQCTDLP